MTLWESVDHLLEGASVDGIRAQKLGPLAAHRLRRLGKPVPPALGADERAAALAMMVTTPLLHRIRASCEGPLLLIKGPEVARLYPGRARSFSDVDLLTPDADLVHRSLADGGFVEVGDPELYRNHHHLRPLQWPTLPLKVEIHIRPMWPRSAEPPALSEIVEAAVPSGLGVEGVLAPRPAHHALILAAHAWVHVPLHTLRDLVDIAAVSADAVHPELERTAQAWGIGRLWRTTSGAVDGLLGEGRQTAALRVWGRHLGAVRERTVVENHLLRWLHGFSELPLQVALAGAADSLRQELLPMPGESWHEKLARMVHALRHPGAPLSWHTSRWRTATRRRGRR